MISNRLDYSSAIIGHIEVPIDPIIDNVLCFINKYLPLFPASLSLIYPPLNNEKLLNQQLVDFFNGHSSEYDYGGYISYKFIFRKDDERADNQSRPDIGGTIWNNKLGRSDNQSFFQMECKRLPTPQLSKDRNETEYVIGTAKYPGGIERFKLNKHGSHINEAAIIGYIQTESIDYWFKKINEWIETLKSAPPTEVTWTSQDHLILLQKGDHYGRYHSTSDRGNKQNIKLHHFLINLQ